MDTTDVKTVTFNLCPSLILEYVSSYYVYKENYVYDFSLRLSAVYYTYIILSLKPQIT